MASAESTMAPESPLDPVKRTLSPEKRHEIESSLLQSIQAAKSDREGLEAKLVYWNQLYEQDLGERDYPWPNAANLFVPIVPTFTDTIVAQLAAMVYVERFFVVNGNDADSAKIAPDVERYYNNEMWRFDWVHSFFDCLGLAARDGTALMEVVWDRTSHTEKRLAQKPRTSNTPFGEITLTDNTGQPMVDQVEEAFEITDYDNVRLNPVELRDFLVIPQWQVSVEAAQAVARAMYLTEDQLLKMVKAGELWEGKTKEAINFSSTLQSDLSHDDMSTDTYQAAGSIQIGVEQGSLISGDIHMIRGPLKIWRVHTRQFDLDGDGVPEENVMYYHDQSKLFIGYHPFPYWITKRPFLKLALMPRFRRFLGFGVPERLQFVQTEANANRNQRIDAVDLRLWPPMYQSLNAKCITGDKEWGPGAKYEVESPQDIGLLQLPNLPPEAFQLDTQAKQDAQELMGFSSPMTGQLSQAKRSKFEMQVAAQATSIRLGHMAQQLRSFARSVLEYVNALKIQYGPDQSTITYSAAGAPKTLTVTKEMLAADLAFDVSGSITAPDKVERQNQAMFVFQALGQDPDVVCNPSHKYAILRFVLEAQGVNNITDLIGTEQEFVEARQQMMQQMQQQQAMGGGSQQGGGQQGGAPAAAAPPGPPGMPPRHG